MHKSLSVIITLGLVLFAATWTIVAAGESCTTPNDKPGTCMPLSDCALYTKVLNRYEEIVPGFFRNFLRMSICSGDTSSPNPNTCCPLPK